MTGRAPKGRATIRDVAERAGVSLTTVSEVVNDRPGARVAEETRRKVQEAATELRYVASPVARNLRRGTSQTMVMLSDEIATTPHSGKLILGAQEYAFSQGWHLLIFDTAASKEAESSDIQRLAQLQVDGVIYASMYHQVLSVPAELRALPTVVLDSEAEDRCVPAVAPDEFGGGLAATRLLTAQGHRDIGLVWNSHDIPATRDRLAGHQRALCEVGVQFRPERLAADRPFAPGGYAAAKALLTDATLPTALFCFNDRMAMGAYRAAADLGLRIPDDLSVVGFDDETLITENLFPPLTTIALPHRQMGRWAVEKLLELVRDGATRREYAPVFMACPVVERSSVAPPPPTVPSA